MCKDMPAICTCFARSELLFHPCLQCTSYHAGLMLARCDLAHDSSLNKA